MEYFVVGRSTSLSLPKAWMFSFPWCITWKPSFLSDSLCKMPPNISNAGFKIYIMLYHVRELNPKNQNINWSIMSMFLQVVSIVYCSRNTISSNLIAKQKNESTHINLNFIINDIPCTPTHSLKHMYVCLSFFVYVECRMENDRILCVALSTVTCHMLPIINTVDCMRVFL